jgi:putative membrane protein
MKLLLRLLINALGLAVAAYIVPGFRIDSLTTLLVAAVLLGVVNASVRPVLIILTLPLSIATLGLFLLVINGLMLALGASLLPGFTIHGLFPAVLGWLIMSLTGWAAAKFIK